jgi:hypothetical protein
MTAPPPSPGPPPAGRVARVLEDGVLAGTLGAVVVALWFLVLDTARGQTFYTPSLLGSVLFLQRGVEQVTTINSLIVFAYTGLHGVLFLLAGLVLAWMFHELEENPQLGIVLLLLFLTFESVLFGFEVAIVPQLVGAVGALAVALANLFAAIAMFWLLLRRRPAVTARLREAWAD